MDVNGKKIKRVDNGRELFYGVVAVASFIVMAIGATFAYFTATASSTNSSVTTGSTTLSLEYINYSSAWMKGDLIPANTAVVEYSVEHQDDTTKNKLCVDDYGNSICSVYQFKVVNNANSPQTVSLDVISEENDFASLNAMAYEVSVAEEDEEEYENGAAGTVIEIPGENEDDPPTEVKVDSTDPVFKLTESYTYPDATPDDPADDVSPIVVTNGDNDVLYQDYEHFAPVYVNRPGVTKRLLKYNNGKDDNSGVKQDPAINRLVPSSKDPLTGTDLALDVEKLTVRVADNEEIPGINDADGRPNYKNFIIVLYIRNSDSDQTKTDAKKSFKGRVVVKNDDSGTGVSGSIEGITSDELQSKVENAPGVTQ